MTLDNFVASKLPWVFLLYAIPSVIILSLIMPPFQVADEFAHVQRADQISHGKLVSDLLGGTIETNWKAIVPPYRAMWFHSEMKQTVATATQSAAIGWSGREDLQNFQNTAQYGPFFYLPQVIGLSIGRLLGWSLAKSMLVARILNGLAACAVTFVALSICCRGMALTFSVALLPMTLSEYASDSQDALLISLTLLVGTMASRALTRRSVDVTTFALFTILLVAMTTARPSEIALALLAPAFVRRGDPHLIIKGVIASLGIVAVVIWMRALSTLIPEPGSGSSFAGQTRFMFLHPLALPIALVNYVIESGSWFLKTVIGYLGWTDTKMPAAYYTAAFGVLFVACMIPGNRGPIGWPAILGLSTFSAFLLTTSAMLYITWTPVGATTVNGLQGRYILGFLPFISWAIPQYCASAKRFLIGGWYVVLGFPIATLIITPIILMDRYYGSWRVMENSVAALLLR